MIAADNQGMGAADLLDLALPKNSSDLRQKWKYPDGNKWLRISKDKL